MVSHAADGWLFAVDHDFCATGEKPLSLPDVLSSVLRGVSFASLGVSGLAVTAKMLAPYRLTYSQGIALRYVDEIGLAGAVIAAIVLIVALGRSKGASEKGGDFVGLAGAVVFAFLAILPSFHSIQPSWVQCRLQLRRIAVAKDEWVAAHDAAAGERVTMEQIREYLKKGKFEKCPMGGTYDIGVVGADPRCSVPGHSLD
jgi:hypothetical protein